jgi:hypothetical protein
MEHTKHIIRAVLLLVLAAVMFVLVRHFLIPKTFGDFGHFRFSSIGDYTAQQPLHGAPGACAECHDEEPAAHAGSKHASVQCESCHGPLGTHVKDGEQIGSMTVNRSPDLCGLCHESLTARPKGFPQVVLADHVIENGKQLAEGVCLECHDAHNPSE